jgi:hypothetical protein
MTIYKGRDINTDREQRLSCDRGAKTRVIYLQAKEYQGLPIIPEADKRAWN